MKMNDIEYAFGRAISDGSIVRFYIGTKHRGDDWAIVDVEDWHLVRGVKWHGRPRGLGTYVYHKASGYLHRLIVAAPKGMDVDHIDGDPRNNSRANLRICTHRENTQFGVDRRRGYSQTIKETARPTKLHVVRMVLADGSVKEYTYPTRSKKGTLKDQIVKRTPYRKMRVGRKPLNS